MEVTVEETCSLFDGGQSARGFVCHTAEILQERVVGGLPAVGSGRRNSLSSRDEGWQAGYSALMQTGGAKPVQEVCTVNARLAFRTSIPVAVLASAERLAGLRACRDMHLAM